MTRWAGKGARMGLKGGRICWVKWLRPLWPWPLNVGVHSIRSQMVMEIITVKIIVYCSNRENCSFKSGDSHYSSANGNTAPNMLQVLFYSVFITALWDGISRDLFVWNHFWGDMKKIYSAQVGEPRTAQSNAITEAYEPMACLRLFLSARVDRITEV